MAGTFRTLTDILKGESHSIIEGLLQKNQSVILSGSDADATSLLALQLATDVAGGKEFLGKYATCGGPVLFFDKDYGRIKRDGTFLERKKSTTDNVIFPDLSPGSEQSALRLTQTAHQALTVVNQFSGSAGFVDWLDKAKVPTIAVFGNSFISTLSFSNHVWVLDAKPEGYTLRLQTHGIALQLVRGDAGFELIGETALQAGKRPEFPKGKWVFTPGAAYGKFVRDEEAKK